MRAGFPPCPQLPFPSDPALSKVAFLHFSRFFVAVPVFHPTATTHRELLREGGLHNQTAEGDKKNLPSRSFHTPCPQASTSKGHQIVFPPRGAQRGAGWSLAGQAPCSGRGDTLGAGLLSAPEAFWVSNPRPKQHFQPHAAKPNANNTYILCY